MTRFFRKSAVLTALLALVAAAGCETRPTGLDPNPNAPEGVLTANARLVSYRNHGLRVMVRDYASVNIDSVILSVQALPGPASMPLLLILDGTDANTFELYRRDDGGKFERTSDATLPSQFKFVNAGYEEFFTPDPAPSGYAPSSYLARGLVNGTATHASPLSNEGQLTQATLDQITYNGPLFPLDSLFQVAWVGVPNAVGYWIHIYEKPIAGFERLLSSYPTPIAYETAGDLLIAYREGNAPGSSVGFSLGNLSGMLVLKSGPPLVGHDYQVRISGVDATGQVIAQTLGDLDSLGLSSDLAYLMPPSFRPDKTKLFFSLGGTKVARRVRPGPAGIVADDPSGAGAVQGRVRHVTRLGFPSIGPYRETFRRAGRP
jgi:hypothetical protein